LAGKDVAASGPRSMRRCIASKVASAFASRVISEITLAVG
jgi:hypothetical protein